MNTSEDVHVFYTLLHKSSVPSVVQEYKTNLK